MRIRGELRLSVGVLLLVQVLTMVAAVALLGRMTPAIDQVLEENEKSIRAVGDMLVALAEVPRDEQDASARERAFERALAVAQGNITEPSEAPLLDSIATEYGRALEREPEALERVRSDLDTLGHINRQSMVEANERAKRLGTAGAWVLVVLGLLGLLLSLALMRRASVKLIEPVYELTSVLEACNEGDPHRRYRPRAASWEFQHVARVVNELVAEHFAEGEQSWAKVAKLDRLALLAVVDELPGALWVCDLRGKLHAANARALELLEADTQEIHAALQQAATAEPPPGFTVVELDGVGWLCRRDAD